MQDPEYDPHKFMSAAAEMDALLASKNFTPLERFIVAHGLADTLSREILSNREVRKQVRALRISFARDGIEL